MVWAIVRVLHWVAAGGFSCRVLSTTCAITSGASGGLRPGRLASRLSRRSLAPRSAPASATPSACSCPPRERSTSSQHGPPTAVRCAIARPIFAAYYGPQSNSPAAPDPRQTARCISLCSYDNYCTTPPQRESSVSLSTLGEHTPREQEGYQMVHRGEYNLPLPARH